MFYTILLYFHSRSKLISSGIKDKTVFLGDKIYFPPSMMISDNKLIVSFHEEN